MVPDRAKTHLLGCKDKIQNTVENLGDKILGNFKVEYDNNKTIIKSYGISAHGSTPEKGKNAIMLLIKLLNEMELTQPEKDFLSFLNAAVDLDTTGKGLGVDFEDKISGRLSLNVGTMELDEYKATVRVNVRYPIKCTGEQIIKRIRENTPSFINIEDISENKPHYVPEDNPMIQKLKKAYKKVTGEEAYCFAIGGGTYARMFENCVAFGPVFPGKPELAHQTDEYIEVEDLIQNFKIYTYVLEDLAK
jgi:succinyl-diaminopimelate desuccinylase